jgi:hypothetical protein
LLIPKDGAKVFPHMFEELEARQAELGIDSYGMSITTMEEVFLKAGLLFPKSKGCLLISVDRLLKVAISRIMCKAAVRITKL